MTHRLAVALGFLFPLGWLILAVWATVQLVTTDTFPLWPALVVYLFPVVAIALMGLGNQRFGWFAEWFPRTGVIDR